MKVQAKTLCFTGSGPFTFTGKERDAETSYSYYGARYYDPEVSALFLSVDPYANKYPGISPYAYCAWNPVKLVDPDGREIDISILEKKTKKVNMFMVIYERLLLLLLIQKQENVN